MRTVFLAFVLFVVALLGLTAAPAWADSEARIGADWVCDTIVERPIPAAGIQREFQPCNSIVSG